MHGAGSMVQGAWCREHGAGGVVQGGPTTFALQRDTPPKRYSTHLKQSPQLRIPHRRVLRRHLHQQLVPVQLLLLLQPLLVLLVLHVGLHRLLLLKSLL